MAIQWGSVYLSGEAAQNGYDCVVDREFTASGMVQEDAIVRGALSRIPRGNGVQEAVFSVNRQHANEATAEEFAQEHPKAFIAAVDDLSWGVGDNWENATVIASVRQSGKHTFTTYRCRGTPS